MAPSIGAGSAELSIERVPTLACSGQCAASTVPNEASSSVQETFPSAALVLIEKPGGRVTVDARISEGDGVPGLCVCGTLSSTSRPLGLSAWVVVGFAVRLGLKLSWSQPVIAGQGPVAWSR